MGQSSGGRNGWCEGELRGVGRCEVREESPACGRGRVGLMVVCVFVQVLTVERGR